MEIFCGNVSVEEDRKCFENTCQFAYFDKQVYASLSSQKLNHVHCSWMVYTDCVNCRPCSASSSGVAVPDAHKMTSAEGMARIVSLLIEGGANTDAQDNQGR